LLLNQGREAIELALKIHHHMSDIVDGTATADVVSTIGATKSLDRVRVGRGNEAGRGKQWRRRMRKLPEREGRTVGWPVKQKHWYQVQCNKWASA
jgi:hypothetical protein